MILSLLLLLVSVDGGRGTPRVPAWDREVWVVYGDSKSCITCYQPNLGNLMNANATTSPIALHTISRAGARMTDMAYAVDIDMVSLRGLRVTKVLFNLGVNGAGAETREQWESGFASVLAAFRVIYPNVQFHLMKPWARATDMTDMHASIAAMIALYAPSVVAGPDETVFLENGDDGATYTDDGVHPNASGKALTAAKWMEALGY